jgi:hypothetical protein
MMIFFTVPGLIALMSLQRMTPDFREILRTVDVCKSEAGEDLVDWGVASKNANAPDVLFVHEIFLDDCLDPSRNARLPVGIPLIFLSICIIRGRVGATH